ncbi:MAG: hypothetical protein QME58_14390, partial [Bacteroidota bacterium]|nr:hypothetical protein [Bacteroidota bacterium]
TIKSITLNLYLNFWNCPIIEWLNDWGCRQFAIEHHELAKQELLNWHIEFSNQLPVPTANLWELNENDYETLRRAYDSLVNRTASQRRRGNNQTIVRFGPTGAAKILFSLRPNTYAPWDEPIRDSLGLNGSADSYIEYLQTINALLNELRPTCEQHGFTLSELPNRLLRPHSSVPKLIDEYYWMTITQNWQPPTSETFRNWADWSVAD